MKYMDGKMVDGQVVSVTKAGPKPSYKMEQQREVIPAVLTTTQTEREDLDLKRRVINSREDKQPKDRGRGGRRSPLKKRSGSSSDGRRRSPSRRRTRSRSRRSGR